MTVEEQVAAAVEATVERFGSLEIAFANAGVFGKVAMLPDYPSEVFARSSP